MPLLNEQQPPSSGSPDDLQGLDILLVEDSPDVGEALKTLLELCGASVAGPAATEAEADALLAVHQPDVALVDFHLRGGEDSINLIERLRARGVPVVLLSGSFEFPELASVEGTTFLEKPASEAQLLARLRPVLAKKLAR